MMAGTEVQRIQILKVLLILPLEVARFDFARFLAVVLVWSFGVC